MTGGLITLITFSEKLFIMKNSITTVTLQRYVICLIIWVNVGLRNIKIHEVVNHNIQNYLNGYIIIYGSR